MPSTFVHALLPSSCAASTSFVRLKLKTRWEWIRFLFVAFFLGNAPDLDLIPAFLYFEHFREIHRAWGHNIFSATLLAVAGRYLLVKGVSPQFSKASGWLLSFFLVYSHLLLDAMFQAHSIGFIPTVPLFWPISHWNVSLPFGFFNTPHLNIPLGKFDLPLFEFYFWKHIFLYEILPSALLFLLWLSAWHVSQRVLAVGRGLFAKSARKAPLPS